MESPNPCVADPVKFENSLGAEERAYLQAEVLSFRLNEVTKHVDQAKAECKALRKEAKHQSTVNGWKVTDLSYSS